MNVGYPFTSTAPQMAENFVQSTAANSTFGSSLKCSAAAVNSGFAFLQCPHPEATRTPWKSQLVLLKYQVLWSYSCTKYSYKWVTPWLRQSVATIPLWRPTFNPRPVYMGYEVESGTGTGHQFFTHQYHSTNALYSLIHLSPTPRTLCSQEHH